MTTNAIDKINSIVACDSRWSGDLIDGEHVLTIDDSGFQKLGIKQAGCMVVAGDLLLIGRMDELVSCPGVELFTDACTQP